MLALLALLVTACSATRAVTPLAPQANPVALRLNGPAHFADWGHSPLRAGDFEAITFAVDATAESGVATVELFVYEYELYKSDHGTPSQRRRPQGLWGRVASYPQPAGALHVATTHTHAPGFAAYTRLEYVWRITDRTGAITERLGITDAGTSPWPTDKVLLFAASRAPMRDLIDIAFFRDVDYDDDRARFARDVEALVRKGFFGVDVFARNRDLWAFYLTDRSADGAALAADIGNESLLPTFLTDFSIPGIDAFCLLHREDYTDRSLLLENFHSLSNNLFSAEAHNWGTAVHECGHAIFHLSDEYDGCACFQTHATSNVFRDRGDCIAWNVASGFPTADCHEVADVYSRSWWSAEEPTFFATAEACQSHNRRVGLSPDSCRTFIDELGRETYWSFESTCIMHDDGDAEVRKFQRACRQIIEAQFAQLRGRPQAPGLAAVAVPSRENIFGYEPVVAVDMHRRGTTWSVDFGAVAMGVPTGAQQGAGEVRMRVVDDAGAAVATYTLANAGAVHTHGATDRFAVPEEGTVRVAVPASAAIARVICEYDREAHVRTPDPREEDYAEPFVFEVDAATRARMAAGPPQRH